MKHLITTTFVLLLTSMALQAATPHKVSFQAVLKEDGSFLSGDKNVDIGVYTESGVSPLWSQTESGYTFRNGLLSATLGTEESIPVSALLNANSRIGITVEGDEEPVFVTMTAVPYAMVSRYAETVATASAETVGGVKIGSGLSIDSDGVLSAIATVSTENTQDAVFSHVLSGTQSGISVTYDDANDQVSYVVASQTDENFSTAYKTKLDSIAAGAEANQHALALITADTGSFTASSVTDTLAVEGGSNIETEISGSTLTISLVGGGDGGLQNLWETMSADSGSATAGTTSDTFTFTGGANTETSISGDSLTIDVSTDNIRDAVFKGDGIGVNEGLYYVYAYADRRATISLLMATDTSLGGVKVADSSRIDIDGDGFLTVDVSGLDADTLGGENASAFQDADDNLSRLSGQAAPSNGQVLIGNASGGYNVANLTAGSGVSITNGSGSISISASGTMTDEEIQDAVFSNVLSGAQSGITVAYDDDNNEVTYTVATQSDENFTSALKTKLDGVETGADVNQNAIRTVSADSGSFSSSSEEGTVTVQGGASITTTISGSTLTVAVSDSNLSEVATLRFVEDAFIYADGAGSLTTASITAQARGLLDDADAATMRTTLGLGTAATSASTAFQDADDNLGRLSGQAAPSNGQVLIGNASGGYSVANLTAGSGVSITNGSGSIEIAASGGGSGWSLTGDSGTTAGTNFLGTTDTQDLVFKVNDTQVMRYIYNADSNIVQGGYSGNSAGSEGAVIAGGGESGFENRISSAIYGVISGGRGNTVGASYATIGGGRSNRTAGQYSFVIGRDNEVTGNYSVALGRESLVQDADYAFSGGYKGEVLDTHHNSFVWSDGEITFQSTAAQEFSVAAAGGFRVWSNADSDTVVDSDELLVFDNRRLGVGGTATTYTLEVHGTAAKTSAGEWSSTSDKRFKKDILPLDNALESILRLKGVSYYWKSPEEHGNQDFMVRGFIAQDVKEVFPTWVSSDDDGYYYVNTIGIDALFVEALRELNHALHSENTALKTQVESLEARLKKIEAHLDM